MSRSLFALVAALPAVLALNNGLALTPQMGWNTWNHFGCGISEDTILSAAKAMISNNLTAYGYECESSHLLPSYSRFSTCLSPVFLRCAGRRL